MRKNIPFRLLIIDDYEPMRHCLQNAFSANGWHIELAISGETCLKSLEKFPYDLLLLDLGLPDYQELSLLEKIKKNYPDTEVIVFSGNPDPRLIKRAFEIGAFDYIEKGGTLDIALLHAKVNKCYEAILAKRLPTRSHGLRGKRVTVSASVKTPKPVNILDQIIGISPVIESLKSKIVRFAPSNLAILISGENGSGKELIAQSIHQQSKRADGPFISFNCGGISEQLMQSELFGSRKGGFTDAIDKIGFLEAANGGTIFLDEIGEMPLSMQIMLLRALETRTIIPVGSTNEIPIDIRIVSATNRNMAEAIKSGAIRQDFYHRICQKRIVSPMLSERVEDIPLLVEHFLGYFSITESQPLKAIDSEALQLLVNHNWTGNVRELRNMIHSLVCATEDDIINNNDVIDCLDDLETL